MPGLAWVHTVLASGTSSRPEVGSSAVAPPMDMEDCPLLDMGLPGCPYRFAEYSGQPFSDGNPAFGLQLQHWSQLACCAIRRRFGWIGLEGNK